MYSKNDYRYYLENQLIHSDDFLAHYGVKGMKWHKHIRSGANEVANIALRVSNNDKLSDARENAEAIRDNIRHPGIDPTGRNTRHNAKSLANNTTSIIKATAKRNAQIINSNTSNKKKKSVKQKVTSLRKKYGLYREKPKGKNIGGGIYVSHS